MESLSEWANLSVRWFHVFAGILWIGATWYFTWLDKTLQASPGGVWMVHSGGFYKVEKQLNPKVDPGQLHWFRFEALLTWLSGLLLLYIVYYAGGGMEEAAVSPGVAIACGLGLLVAGWFAYDLLWMSPLGRRPAVGAAVCYLALVALAYGLTHLFNGRAAYIHLGAMMGTLMTLNVWVRILPAQKKLVAALASGATPDPVLAAQAKDRSKHNTFLILPVILTMISSHFPTATYGAVWTIGGVAREANWLVFGVLTLAGWGAARVVRELR